MHHRDTMSFTADSAGEASAVECSRSTSDTCSAPSADSSPAEVILTAFAGPDARMTPRSRTEQPPTVSDIVRIYDILCSLIHRQVNILLDGRSRHDRIQILADVRTEYGSILAVQSQHILFAILDLPVPSIIISQRRDSASSVVVLLRVATQIGCNRMIKYQIYCR